MRGGSASGYRSQVATATLRLASPQELDAERSREPAAVRRPWRLRAAALVPAVLMLCVGLVGLDRHSVWRDEAASLVAARRSAAELWTMLGHVETVHALYYGFLHVWLLPGGGEVWARVPSVLAMAVAAGLVGAIGARVVSVPVGLVAGLLFVANPSVSYYAQEARSTALVVAVALLATWFLLHALDERRPGWWAAYAVAGTVLVGLNVLAVLVLLAHAVTLLWWRRPRRVLLRWALLALPAGIVAGLLVLAAGQQPYQIGWIPRPGLSSVREFAYLVLGPTHPLVAVVGLLVLVALLPGASAPTARLRGLALPVLVLPVAVLLAVSLVQPIFVPRYVFPSVAAACLLAAAGVVRLAGAAARRAGSRATAVVALVAAAAVLVVTVLGLGAQRLERTPLSRPDDLAGAAAVVAAGARPGDGLLFLPDNRRLVALVYPRSFAALHDVALAAGPDEAGNLTGRELPLPQTLANLDASPRVWVVGRPDLALLPSETDSRAELDLLGRDFVPVQRSAAHGVGITLYARRPAAT